VIFFDRLEEFFNKPDPRKRAPFLEIIFLRIVRKRFEFKWVIAISDVVTLAIHSAQKIKEGIEQPMENKEHFNLLPEMNFFVTDQLRLIISLACNPDEDEKR
jgi:hypothetical protein